MDVNERIRQLEIEACLAIRNNQFDTAERIWHSMLIHAKIKKGDKDITDGEIVIKSLKNFLAFTARSHNLALFESWLMPTWETINSSSFYKELGEFVNGMAFIIADHNIESSLSKLEILFKQYIHIARIYDYDLEPFLSEWLEIAAELTYRGADNINKKMILLLTKGTYYVKDWQKVHKILWRYRLYMQVYTQHNDFKQALIVYGGVHYLEIIFNEKIFTISDKYDKKLQQKYLYCGIRDWLLTIAKITKETELMVINEWYKMMTEKLSLKLRNRFNNLFDAVMLFWQDTQPDTYAKIMSER